VLIRILHTLLDKAKESQDGTTNDSVQIKQLFLLDMGNIGSIGQNIKKENHVLF
jgi:hypothetical protein